MIAIISFSIGLFIGFCLCALLSANKIDGEIYYIDLSDRDNDIINDNDGNDNEGGNDAKI